jgi:hypothetical protein
MPDAKFFEDTILELIRAQGLQPTRAHGEWHLYTWISPHAFLNLTTFARVLAERLA